MLEKEQVMKILGKQLELLSEYVQKPRLMTQEMHMLSQDITAISRVILEFQDRRLGATLSERLPCYIIWSKKACVFQVMQK